MEWFLREEKDLARDEAESSKTYRCLGFVDLDQIIKVKEVGSKTAKAGQQKAKILGQKQKPEDEPTEDVAQGFKLKANKWFRFKRYGIVDM